MSAVIVVPSLKISGGNREALRLTADLSRNGHRASVLSLWSSPHAMASSVPVHLLSSWPPRASRALLELPMLAWRFATWWRKTAQRRGPVVFTHYATLPLALLVPRIQRCFFVQDLEWNFIGEGPMARVLRRIVLGIYRSGRIISANAYLTERLLAEGMVVELEAPIWADPFFLAPDAPQQDIDYAMVLRKGAHKRLDLYLRFIDMARARHRRVAVITPEDDIAHQVRGRVDEVLLRPRQTQMRDIYARSHCFIHLSEHEGFGLPPLEAMGAGCQPVCRDSGGVRAFMRASPCAAHLLPLQMPIEEVFDHAEAALHQASDLARRGDVRAHFEGGLARCEQGRTGLLHALYGNVHP